MSKRRDVFIFVAEPGKADEAQTYLGAWLRSLEGHPGYLGGSVLQEVAGELLPGTLVLIMEFASTDDARALWPKIENTVNPLYPDDKSDTSPDQGTAFFDGTRDALANGTPLPLRFTRGNGLLARMLHIHAAEVDAFAPVA
ncbi:hypothetical protein [Streptomyces radicis]|uniref:Antibiotic biosynthesis monooxygenase n=1 Tax=Streptomyces radicis TaxID=1750517 RepID=A0A3A9WI14_9ACTN|nr:hypothetical protein [Streptomyces radicis]RKN12841.1 hypothetical protein D7319_02610 [Streptomyces radicis]RKN27394.1 hypothetical protein D7318_00285 [Streptomyces radicis]